MPQCYISNYSCYVILLSATVQTKGTFVLCRDQTDIFWYIPSKFEISFTFEAYEF